MRANSWSLILSLAILCPQVHFAVLLAGEEPDEGTSVDPVKEPTKGPVSEPVRCTIEQFFKAAHDNDAKEVSQCISLGIGVETKNSAGKTALFTAACQNAGKVVEVLLKNGAIVEPCMNDQQFRDTALGCAVKAGAKHTLRLLAQKSDLYQQCGKYRPVEEASEWYSVLPEQISILAENLDKEVLDNAMCAATRRDQECQENVKLASSCGPPISKVLLAWGASYTDAVNNCQEGNDLHVVYRANAVCLKPNVLSFKDRLQTTSPWSSLRWSGVACDIEAASKALKVGLEATSERDKQRSELTTAREIAESCGCSSVSTMLRAEIDGVECDEAEWFKKAAAGNVAYMEKCRKFLNKEDDKGRTAVWFAACSKGGPYVPALEALAKLKPSPGECPDLVGIAKKSAIACAIELGNLRAVKVLAPITDLGGGNCPNTPMMEVARSKKLDRVTMNEIIGYLVDAGLLQTKRYQDDLSDNSFWLAYDQDMKDKESAFRVQVLMSWGIPMTQKKTVQTRAEAERQTNAVNLLSRCPQKPHTSCGIPSSSGADVVPEDFTPLVASAISCDTDAAKYWFSAKKEREEKEIDKKPGWMSLKTEILVARSCSRICDCPAVLDLIDADEAAAAGTTTTMTTTTTTKAPAKDDPKKDDDDDQEQEEDTTTTTEKASPPEVVDDKATTTTTTTTTMSSTTTTTTTEDLEDACLLPRVPHAATPMCLEEHLGDGHGGKAVGIPHEGVCTPQCEAGYQLRPDSPPHLKCIDGKIPSFTCVSEGVMLGATLVTATSVMGSATAAATGGVTAVSAVSTAGGTVGTAGAGIGAGATGGSAGMAAGAETAGLVVSPGVASAAPDATSIAKAFKAQGRGLREGGIGSDNLHHDFFNTELEDQGRCSAARIKRFFKKYGSLSILFLGSLHCIFQGAKRGASLWPGILFSLLTFVGICVVACSAPGSGLARSLQAITARGEKIHPRFWGRMELTLSCAVAAAVLIERGTHFLGLWSASVLVVGGLAYYKRWRCPCYRRCSAAVIIYICGGVVALSVVIFNLIMALVGGVAATLSCWTALSKGAETALDNDFDEDLTDAVVDVDPSDLSGIELPVVASTLTNFDDVDYVEADDGFDCALEVLDSNWIAAALEALMLGKESSDTLASMHVKYQERPPLEGTIEEAKDFGHWVATVWTEKEGTLLDELCSLLRQPADGERGNFTPANIGLELLQALVIITKDWYGDDYEEPFRRTPLSLFCASLFTMQDADIDRLCLFPDVPPCPKDVQAQDAYEHYRHYRETMELARNPQFFEVSTWAMRMCWDTFAEGKYPIEETFSAFNSFVKWLSCISCFRQVIEPSLTVYRVFRNVPKDILEQLQQKKNGGIVFWPCPTSTTQGRELAEQVAATDSPESNVIFSVQGVREGWRLAPVSLYPNEAEILLPMCSVLKVRSVQPGPPLKVNCFYEACSLPIGFERAVVRDLRQCDASMRESRSSRRSARPASTPGPSFAASEAKPVCAFPSISVSAVSSTRNAHDAADDDDNHVVDIGEARQSLIGPGRASVRPSAVWSTPKEVTEGL